MANKYVNKLIVGTEVKLDLSGDTIVASDLKKGVTAHDKSGAPITGTNEFDVNSQDADAAVAEVLKGKTFYARGSKLTGTMPDNGAKTLEIADAEDEPTIAMGFHDGSGKARIKATEKAKIIPGNIQVRHYHSRRGGQLRRRGGQGSGEQERHAELCRAGRDAG